MKGVLVLKTLLLLSLPLSGLSSKGAARPSPLSPALESLLVRCKPEFVVNGSPVIFQVRSAKSLKYLAGAWQGRKVFFDFDAASRTWYGFAGVSIETASAQHPLALVATFASGERISISHSVTVGKADYRNIDLSVSRKFTEPDAETVARINQEKALKSVIFRRVSRNRRWGGGFVAPVENVITDSFGTGRTFNGVQQSVHHGLDFRADPGTPVGAMNSGRIIIARDMFYEGGFVVIDHGQGLLTLYMHLSEIGVNEGAAVKKGQIIGLSGASGRTTGPHLHVGVRWQGIYLDPEALLALPLG
jgi:murein DD-endopeptidase MepM/ murein hydrolase activator NlpD